MTPEELEVRCFDPLNDRAVATLLEEVRADPDWSVTEVRIAGRLVEVALVYAPTGLTYTLTTTRRRRPQDDADAGAPDRPSA